MSNIPHPEGSPAFKFEETSAAGPNSIQGIQEVKSYLVAYTDGKGEKQVRLALCPPGLGEKASVFLAREKIQGQVLFADSQEWFRKKFLQHLQQGQGVESV